MQNATKVKIRAAFMVLLMIGGEAVRVEDALDVQEGLQVVGDFAASDWASVRGAGNKVCTGKKVEGKTPNQIRQRYLDKVKSIKDLADSLQHVTNINDLVSQGKHLKELQGRMERFASCAIWAKSDQGDELEVTQAKSIVRNSMDSVLLQIQSKMLSMIESAGIFCIEGSPCQPCHFKPPAFLNLATWVNNRTEEQAKSEAYGQIFGQSCSLEQFATYVDQIEGVSGFGFKKGQLSTLMEEYKKKVSNVIQVHFHPEEIQKEIKEIEESGASSLLEETEGTQELFLILGIVIAIVGLILYISDIVKANRERCKHEGFTNCR